MTETLVVKCKKCGKPVSLNVTFNNVTATAPPPNIQSWTVDMNNTGTASQTYTSIFPVTATTANPSSIFITNEDMCQCGGT